MEKQRAKYGEPLVWLNNHSNFQSDECLPWPYGKAANGYGSVRVGGKTAHAHAVMCRIAHGPPPTATHTDVAHSCVGRRDCCNPRHLRHATPAENQQDKIVQGTMPRGSRHSKAKLSETAVRDIRAAIKDGSATQAQLARKYDVSHKAVAFVVSGANWGWLK